MYIATWCCGGHLFNFLHCKICSMVNWDREQIPIRFWSEILTTAWSTCASKRTHRLALLERDATYSVDTASTIHPLASTLKACPSKLLRTVSGTAALIATSSEPSGTSEKLLCMQVHTRHLTESTSRNSYWKREGLPSQPCLTAIKEDISYC